MEIIYLANFNNPNGNPHEEAIERAFKDAGHTVKRVEERDFAVDTKLPDGELLIFHKGAATFGLAPRHLVAALDAFRGAKVCLYFDKVWNERVMWMHEVIPHVDLMLMSDGEFVRTFNYLNTFELKQGVGAEHCVTGTYRDEFAVDVAFIGSVYGARQQFVQLLDGYYKNRFKVFSNVWGDDLNDLCASAKVIVAPKFPQNDFYWSQRPYELIGRGGFLVHPRLWGLEKELTNGKHYVSYKQPSEMLELIDHYLDDEKSRKRIKKQGMEYIKEHHTYQQTVKQVEKLLCV